MQSTEASFIAMTRRTLITAALGLRSALGQIDRSRFTVTSHSGLRLERHGDPQRPTVAVYLPDRKDPSAIIEMPEHAWRRRRPTSEQIWFYKMYTSDSSLRGEVNWARDGNTLSFAMKTPSGFLLNSRARLDADGVDITHEIINAAEPDWAVVEATTCVKLYRPFTDIFLERTYVHHPEGLELIASETPDRLAKNAEEWLPCRYIVSCDRNAPPPAKKVERLDGVTRYFKSKVADVGFIATESQPGGWLAATYSKNCPAIFTNPARTCHHADPRAHSINNGRALLRLKVYIRKGTLLDTWDLVSKRDRSDAA
jgi:hypothetical protein